MVLASNPIGILGGLAGVSQILVAITAVVGGAVAVVARRDAFARRDAGRRLGSPRDEGQPAGAAGTARTERDMTMAERRMVLERAQAAQEGSQSDERKTL
jgi:hypothetical protein